MSVRVAGGFDDGGRTVVVNPNERVRGLRRFHGVDRNLNITVGCILEADRHGQPRCHLAVGLRFGRARTNGGPSDQVVDVLGRDRVKHFSANRKSETVDVE